MKYNKERASAAMVIIYLLVVIVWLSGYATLFAKRNIKILQEEERSLHLNIASKEKTTNNKKGFSFGKLSCKTGKSKLGSVVIKKELCSQNNNFGLGLLSGGLVTGKNSSSYPLLNYNLIFKNAINCESPFEDAPFELNQGTARSAFVCNDALELFVKDYVVKGNLEITAAAITSAKIVSGVKIAATGYINADILTVVGPVVILAGGDIHISTLIVPTEKLADILIYSATGAVTIDNIVGDGDFYVFSWLGATLPGGINLEQNRLLPKQLSAMPLFLSSEED